MRRRQFMLTAGAAALGLSAFPRRRSLAARAKKPKILYFTRSAGYEHSAVAPVDGDLPPNFDKVTPKASQLTR